MPDEVAVITTLGCGSRRAERASLAEALSAFRRVIWMQDPARLEGGDVMRIGKDLFVGLSARTDKAGVTHLAEVLRPFGYRVIPVELRGCLHLKSACSYVGDGGILSNRGLLNSEPLRGYRFIDVAALDQQQPMRCAWRAREGGHRGAALGIPCHGCLVARRRVPGAFGGCHGITESGIRRDLLQSCF